VGANDSFVLDVVYTRYCAGYVLGTEMRLIREGVVEECGNRAYSHAEKVGGMGSCFLFLRVSDCLWYASPP
jgi:hypothetical protein